MEQQALIKRQIIIPKPSLMPVVHKKWDNINVWPMIRRQATFIEDRADRPQRLGGTKRLTSGVNHQCTAEDCHHQGHKTPTCGVSSRLRRILASSAEPSSQISTMFLQEHFCNLSEANEHSDSLKCSCRNIPLSSQWDSTSTP